jgi:hypothetical protein
MSGIITIIWITLREENVLTVTSATSRDDGETVMCEVTIVSAAIHGTFIRDWKIRDAGIMIDRQSRSVYTEK